MGRRLRTAISIAVVLGVLSASLTGSSHVTAAAKEYPHGGHSGTRSLGVDVSSDGEALDNVPITVVNEKTENQVFSGYTDSAGQVDVTLPQNKYEVVAQSQSEKVNLNKDQNVSFELNDDERPTE